MMTRNVDNQGIFGASACITIQFDGTLECLAEKLAESLNLKAFNVEANQDPPHKMIGSAEALGWEIWLEEDSPHRFRLRIETEHSTKEAFDGNLHDLSPWFARLISTLCGLKTQRVRPL